MILAKKKDITEKINKKEKCNQRLDNWKQGREGNKKGERKRVERDQNGNMECKKQQGRKGRRENTCLSGVDDVHRTKEEYANQRILAVKLKLDKEEETSTLIIAYGVNDDDNFFEELQNQINNRNNRIIENCKNNGRPGWRSWK